MGGGLGDGEEVVKESEKHTVRHEGIDLVMSEG